MKIAFGTVIHPGTIKFLDDFIISMNQQEYRDNLLIVIAESVSEEIKKRIQQEVRGDVCIFDSKSAAKPFENRVQLLFEAKRLDVDMLVLGDSDDIADKQRIQCYVDQYDSNYAIFYNDILTFDGDSIFPVLPPFSKRENLLDHNYLGLSNTALNMRLVLEPFIVSLSAGNTYFFDWYLFARILGEIGDAKHISHALTYYRVYDDNLAGDPSAIDLEKELNVKLKHYNLMARTDSIYEPYEEKCKLLLNDVRQKMKSIAPDQGKSFWWDKINISDYLREE